MVLVDDHASILDSLQTLLQGADDVTVVARCELGSGERSSEALATILDRQRVILLDLRVPVMERLASCGRWSGLGAHVVILTGAIAESAIETVRLGTRFGEVALACPEFTHVVQDASLSAI